MDVSNVMEKSFYAPRSFLIEDFIIPSLDDKVFGNTLEWEDRSTGTFKIYWPHKSAKKWKQKDFQVFLEWDKCKFRNDSAEGHFSRAKGRFRSALNRLKSKIRLLGKSKRFRIYQLTNFKAPQSKFENLPENPVKVKVNTPSDSENITSNTEVPIQYSLEASMGSEDEYVVPDDNGKSLMELKYGVSTPFNEEVFSFNVDSYQINGRSDVHRLQDVHNDINCRIDEAGKSFMIEDFILPSLDNKVFGDLLFWEDKSIGTFKIFWPHKGQKQFQQEYFQVFIEWDKRKNRNDRDSSSAKSRFRAALYKLNPKILLLQKSKKFRTYQIKNIKEYESRDRSATRKSKSKKCLTSVRKYTSSIANGVEACTESHFEANNSYPETVLVVPEDNSGDLPLSERHDNTPAVVSTPGVDSCKVKEYEPKNSFENANYKHVSKEENTIRIEDKVKTTAHTAVINPSQKRAVLVFVTTPQHSVPIFSGNVLILHPAVALDGATLITTNQTRDAMCSSNEYIVPDNINLNVREHQQDAENRSNFAKMPQFEMQQQENKECNIKRFNRSLKNRQQTRTEEETSQSSSTKLFNIFAYISFLQKCYRLISSDINDLNSLSSSVLHLPDNLYLAISSIPAAGYGIWSKSEIPVGMVFGPFEGEFDLEELSHSEKNCCQIKSEQIDEDATTEYTNNWMSYINFAYNERQQNLIAYQCDGKTFYRSTRAIVPDTELFVWYEDEDTPKLDAKDKFNSILKDYKNSNPNSMEDENSQQCQDNNTKKLIPELIESIFTIDQQFYYHKSTSKKEFLDALQLKKNEPIHAEEKYYPCDICHKKFKKQIYLQIHRRLHKEKPYDSNVYRKVFLRDFNLKKHRQFSTESKFYACGNTYKRFYSEEKSHVCNLCEKAFLTLIELKCHQRFHTVRKVHKRKICNKIFSKSSSLRKHKTIHKDKKLLPSRRKVNMAIIK